MNFLKKIMDYLPLIPIFWFLITPIGGASRTHNPNYAILYFITIPVWTCVVMATLKIRKARRL